MANIPKKEIMRAKPADIAAVEEVFRPEFERVLLDPDFFRADTFRAQCKRAYALINGGRPKRDRVPLKHFAAFLRVRSVSSVAAQLRSTDDTHVVHGRIAHLTDEDVGAVVAWVNASVDDPRSLMTLDNIVERLWAERERLVTKECLRKHLSDAALTKTVTAFPMEVERLRVTADAMAAYFDTAERIVCGIPAAFVFNVDESGVQEYADARGVDVVVPVSFEGMTAHYGTRRNAYRSTLVACISADGSALPPLVVMKAKTVPERIVLDGWTADKVRFATSATGFVTQRIFDDWFESVFVAAVERRRVLHGAPAQRAVLLLDGFSGHKSERFTQLCAAHRIDPVYFTPHASHLLQPLDLCLFGAMKSRLQKPVPVDDRPQVEHLYKLLGAVNTTCTVSNVVGSFRRAGFRNTVVVDGKPMVTFHRGWVRTIQWSEEDQRRLRREPEASVRKIWI